MKNLYITKEKHEIEPIHGGHQVIKSEYGGLNNIGRDLEKVPKHKKINSFRTLKKFKNKNNQF
jgi:hypothetical protein